MRNRPRPGEEFFKRIGVAGAIALVDAVGPCGAPLVGLPFQPDPGQIAELVVFGDLARGQMAMIIEDRFRLGEGVIQMPRRCAAE